MGKEKIILTGDRPTGRLHVGHYVGSSLLWKKLPESGKKRWVKNESQLSVLMSSIYILCHQ
jgi:hypothetical protein